LGRRRNRLAGAKVKKLNVVAENAGDLKLFESDNLARKGQKGRDVGGDEVFAVTEANDER